MKSKMYPATLDFILSSKELFEIVEDHILEKEGQILSKDLAYRDVVVLKETCLEFIERQDKKIRKLSAIIGGYKHGKHLPTA